LKVAKMFPSLQSKPNPAKFMYQGVEVTFKQGRFLVLQSYLATTWALYDAVSKIAGVLCCVDELAKNRAIPIKLPEHLLKGDNCVGFHVQDHLKGGYGYPIAISYAIRNWVVHSGHSQNGFELFESDSPNGPPYRLSDRAWAQIRDKVAAEYNTRLRPFPEMQEDVLQGLMTCHKEIDEAIGFILCWSTEAARLQAEILLPRDITAAALPVEVGLTAPIVPPPAVVATAAIASDAPSATGATA